MEYQWKCSNCQYEGNQGTCHNWRMNGELATPIDDAKKECHSKKNKK